VASVACEDGEPDLVGRPTMREVGERQVRAYEREPAVELAQWSHDLGGGPVCASEDALRRYEEKRSS
jgi:hypothetical protein